MNFEGRQRVRYIDGGDAGIEQAEPEIEVHREVEILVERPDAVERPTSEQGSRLRDEIPAV